MKKYKGNLKFWSLVAILLEPEKPETKQKKTPIVEEYTWVKEIVREEVKEFMKKWVQDHIYNIK